MARILAVHGIGQQFEGADLLRQRWLPALKGGLSRVGRKLNSDVEFECAFYGDLFRPKGKALTPPLDASDVTEEWEQAMLLAWWQEASRLDIHITNPAEKTKVYAPQFVQRALNALSQSEFFREVAERALILDLKQVYRYLHDPIIRQQAQLRVADVITSDTQVLVGHSLGSIVAYEALCAHPEWNIVSFVTLGSPLGIAKLIFDYLEPKPKDGRGVWPGKATHWFNIADGHDLVALQKRLDGLFAGPVQDHLVDNGISAHDVSRYLTAEETGYAISKGL